MMNMVTEKVIRLRLSMDVEEAPLMEHPLIKASAGKIRSRQVTEIYYDTPRHGLYRHGLRLMICRAGKKWLQRFGLAGSQKKGTWWQWSQSDSVFDPTRMRKNSKVRKTLDKIKLAEVGPIFTLDYNRNDCILSFPDGARVELAEERGEWFNNASRTTFHELALTLLAGNPDRLYQTALTLAYYLKPGLECASPEEHGYLLLDHGLALPLAGGVVSLKGNMDAEESFLVTNAALLRSMQGNQCAALQGEGAARAGGLAGMFRSVGQLRAMVTLYDFLLPSETRLELDDELKWLQGELAPARDWEIFISGTLDRFVAHFPGYPSLKGLRELAQERQEEAYRRMEDAITSFRFTRLALGLANWLGLQGWRDLMDHPQRREMSRPVAVLARESMQRHHYQIRKLGRRFDETDQEGRRRLCDAADLLAYASSLFDALFSGKAIDRYREALDRLRQEIHPLNEVDAARRLFGEIVSNEDDAVFHLVNGWLGSREERRTQDSRAAWEAFSSCSAYWH